MTHATTMKNSPKHKDVLRRCGHGTLIGNEQSNASSLIFFRTTFNNAPYRHRLFLGFGAIALSFFALGSDSFAQYETNQIPSSAIISIIGLDKSVEVHAIPLENLEIQTRTSTVSSETELIFELGGTNLSYSGDSFRLLYDYNNVNTLDELIEQQILQLPYLQLKFNSNFPVSWDPGMRFHINQYPDELSSVFHSLDGLLDRTSDYPTDYSSADAIVSLRDSAAQVKSALSSGAIAISSEELDALRAEYDSLNAIVAKLNENRGRLDSLSSVDRLRFESLVLVAGVRKQALTEVDGTPSLRLDALKREVEVPVAFPDGRPSSQLKVERYIPYRDRMGNPLPVQQVGTSTPARARLNIAHACYYGKDHEGRVVTDIVAHSPRTMRTFKVPLRNVGRQNVESNRDEVCIR